MCNKTRKKKRKSFCSHEDWLDLITLRHSLDCSSLLQATTSLLLNDWVCNYTEDDAIGQIR